MPFLGAEPSFTQLGIVCDSALEDPSVLTTGSDGTGPYVVDEFVTGSHITLTRNDDYAWGPEGFSVKDLPKTVNLNIVEDLNTQVNLLLGGDADNRAAAGRSARAAGGRVGLHRAGGRHRRHDDDVQRARRLPDAGRSRASCARPGPRFRGAHPGADPGARLRGRLPARTLEHLRRPEGDRRRHPHRRHRGGIRHARRSRLREGRRRDLRQGRRPAERGSCCRWSSPPPHPSSSPAPGRTSA